MEKIIEEYLATMINVYDMSSNTIQSYSARINQFIKFMNIGTVEDFKNINLFDLEKYLTHLTSIGNNSSSKQNKVTAINSFCEYLVSHDMMTINPCKKLKRIKIEQTEQSYLTEEESISMIEHSTDRRSKSIVALCLQCGLRVSEVIKLSLSDLYLENEQWTIIIRLGKGKKDRIVYVDEYTKRIIDAYLCVRKQTQYDNLFISDRGTPMLPHSLNRTLKIIALKANINKNITIHTLRRSMATRLNDSNVPITYIQNLMGHAHYETTLRYIKVDKTKVLNNSMATALMRAA